MLKSLFLRNSVLFLAAVSPAVVSAQFQQPTPEELKMTDDPKAPGATAVYLNIEEVTDDPLHHCATHLQPHEQLLMGGRRARRTTGDGRERE